MSGDTAIVGARWDNDNGTQSGSVYVYQREPGAEGTWAFTQKLLAYTLVAIGRIISKRVKGILVSAHIGEAEAERMGFLWAPSLQEAADRAMEMTGPGSRVMVLKEAGEIIPRIRAVGAGTR